MASIFAVVQEDFDEELEAIGAVIGAFSDPANGNPRTRVAAANAATLLLAATFEEFVREMARAYARSVVEACASSGRLPKKLLALAWRRTMESLARLKPDDAEGVPADALSRFNVVYDFCRGDLTQDIYKDLIHNEHNMRPEQINALFKLSELGSVCSKTCDKHTLQNFLEEDDPGRLHGVLLSRLEDFFERRNQIAHDIYAMRSSGPDLILQDIGFLSAFAVCLTETLDHEVCTRG